MFRPIADHQLESGLQHMDHLEVPAGQPAAAAATAVQDHGGCPPTTLTSLNSLVMRPQMTMSPTRPKLYSCWRRSEEAWSSTGSRHSSRPGSSTASSSRPPSQPNTNAGAAGQGGLYCKSNNSSLSDVSVARNFQQLSVSSRRALFKTQKWSHSFDQPALSAQAAQMSPGRRRQSSLQQKSLDLDSGYSGSSGSWAEPVSAAQRVNLCCSPLDSVKRELDKLRETTGTSTAGGDVKPPWELDRLSEEQQTVFEQQQPLLVQDPESRSASLPSFPESFNVVTKLRPDVNLIPPDESLDDLDEEIKMIVARAEKRNNSSGSDGLLTFLEEHGIDTTSGQLNVDDLSDEEDLEELDHNHLYVRPEPGRTRNPLLCQKSSSSSGYDTCISSVSDNLPSTSSTGSGVPMAPPRPKRALAKARAVSKSPQPQQPPSGKSDHYFS
jgi:hypothetical protein